MLETHIVIIVVIKEAYTRLHMHGYVNSTVYTKSYTLWREYRETEYKECVQDFLHTYKLHPLSIQTIEVALC